MSTPLIIFCFVIGFFLIGFSFMFNYGFKQKTLSNKILGILSSIIVLCAFIFLVYSEYKKEIYAKTVVSDQKPIEYIERDTIKLYEIDGRYYRYAPRMNQLVYYSSSIDSVNVIPE